MGQTIAYSTNTRITPAATQQSTIVPTPGCPIKRLLTIIVPIKFREVHVWDESTDISKSCLYSWSTDSVCWTNFVTYDEYLRIAPNIESDFYLRIMLFAGFTKLSLDSEVIDCYNICLWQENPYVESLCEQANAIDLYGNLDCALYMQQQLSDYIVCMIGIPCYYFRVLPDQDTSDLTFKEYVLHNVEEVKYIKLVVQDGEMPSSRPMMTDFDFDWDTDWEVEVGKSMFAQAFGDTAFPKQRDFIYVPMMKRMWEVNSAYDEKREGFMWRPTTWKLGLVKFNEKTNVNQGDFSEIIDGWLVNKYEDFHENELIEQERQSGTIQTESPKYAATNLYNIFMSDNIRKGITESEKSNVIQRQYNQKANVVARNAYAFQSEDSIMTYQKGWCGDSGMLSFIIETEKATDKDIIILGPGLEVKTSVQEDSKKTKKYTISFLDCSVELELEKAYQIIIRWSRNTFAVEMSACEYKCRYNAPVARPEMFIFDYINPINSSAPYNNDLSVSSMVPLVISPAPCLLTNIKLYNQYMPWEDAVKETCKYTTNSENCIINDLARPIEGEWGFATR